MASVAPRSFVKDGQQIRAVQRLARDIGVDLDAARAQLRDGAVDFLQTCVEDCSSAASDESDEAVADISPTSSARPSLAMRANSGDLSGAAMDSMGGAGRVRELAILAELIHDAEAGVQIRDGGHVRARVCPCLCPAGPASMTSCEEARGKKVIEKIDLHWQRPLYRTPARIPRWPRTGSHLETLH